MNKRKRSLSVEEDYYAECPFTISYETGHQRGNKHKKRKSDGQDENNQTRSQISPFKPKGSFKTHKNMNLEYTVELEYTGELECTAELKKGWRGMTRYRHFVLNTNKYNEESFVYVTNEVSVENKKAQDYGLSIYKKNKHDWVARILEIRASDECHVYARIYWMYRPEELPLGTVDGGKKVQGRQPYHGVNELIATNHMDIINVISIAGLATVDQWIESDTKEVPKELYWRQTFDFRNLQLSSVELICECQEPTNPDKIVLECTNSKCGKSLHEECMTHKILMQVHERLDLDKVNVSRWLAGKEQKPKATHPLSPPSTEEKETRPTIDVGSNKTYDGLRCKKAAHETDREVGSLVGGRTPSGGIATAPAKQSAKKGHRKARRKTAGPKPYEGLFKATLKMKDGRPTSWEIRDLRESVIGSAKSWTEDIYCLLCGSVIN